MFKCFLKHFYMKIQSKCLSFLPSLKKSDVKNIYLAPSTTQILPHGWNCRCTRLKPLLTWEASMCWDRWKGKGLGVPPDPWPVRLPFSKPLAPDTEANRWLMPIAEKAPGAMANWLGWNNRGEPVFRGLKNCWLCSPDRARLCKWPGLKCEGLSVWTMRGEKVSLLALMPPASGSFVNGSVVSFLCLPSALSFSRFLMLNMESSFFSVLGLSRMRSSHLEL